MCVSQGVNHLGDIHEPWEITMKQIQTTLLAALALSVAACQSPANEGATPHEPPPMAAAKLEPYQCGTVTRLHTFEGLFLASQPSAADFEQAAKGGIRTVLNIRYDAEQPDMDERAVVLALGLNYIHIPWNGPDELTDEIFDELRAVLNEAERPILFHCGSANRVGAVWMAYRMLEGGLSEDEARAEAKTVGLRSPAYEKKAIDYANGRS